MRPAGNPSWPARGVGACILALAGVLTASVPAAAQLRSSLADAAPAGYAETGYRVRPVDGAPAGPGVRRAIERFAGWTLICDEMKGRRVCNAVQSIADADGHLAFSWSLAATRGGEPVFLVRAPVTAFPAHTVTLDFEGAETTVRLSACDAHLCVGFLPLDPAIVRQIERRARVGIRYRTADGVDPVAFTASLDGLGAAIGSIRR